MPAMRLQTWSFFSLSLILSASSRGSFSLNGESWPRPGVDAACWYSVSSTGCGKHAVATTGRTAMINNPSSSQRCGKGAQQSFGINTQQTRKKIFSALLLRRLWDLNGLFKTRVKNVSEEHPQIPTNGNKIGFSLYKRKCLWEEEKKMNSTWKSAFPVIKIVRKNSECFKVTVQFQKEKKLNENRKFRTFDRAIFIYKSDTIVKLQMQRPRLPFVNRQLHVIG